jgi:predicted tellurium resistance membrane protein TerC
MMELLSDPNAWLALLTLTALEIVLGIDNLVFIAILANRLPEHRRAAARRFGLALALVSRLMLLFFISWIIGLTAPLFEILGEEVSWRDIILIAGGMFLIAKATLEIDHKLEAPAEEKGKKKAAAAAGAAFTAVVIQIAILDIVFSLDSVITAVGMADHIEIMATAIIIAIIVMLFSAGPLTAFLDRHPTVTMLALAFLLMIGVMLVADGLGFHIPKGYIYFAMGFSVLVESLNLVRRARQRAAD